MGTTLNLARNSFRSGYAPEMARKLFARMEPDERDGAAQWCRANQIDAVEWAKSVDPDLWAEAEAFAAEQREIAAAKGINVGTAKCLLYFIARLTRPRTIVETGVAYGFSSRAFLKALAEYGGWRLFSSDFPYFRKANPEKLIGCMVENQLRNRWTLLLKGDRMNLPRIAKAARKIDLFHYDSDKSRAGRALALKLLEPCFTPETTMIFDDIGDNLHFRDFVRDKPFLVLAGKRGWVGVTGHLLRMTHAIAPSATTISARNTTSQMVS